MRRPRVSIASLMGIVMVAAVGLAAWRNANETWAGIMLLVTCGTLALAVVGAIYCKGARRAWWLGFSIFGWGYMALLKCCSDASLTLHPLALLLKVLEPVMGPPPVAAIFVGFGGAFGGGGGGLAAADRWLAMVVQCLWTLLIASIGGTLARFFFASARDDSDGPRPDAPAAGDPSRSRWLPPTIIGLAALIAIAAIATIGAGAGAPLWAGLTFSMTCAFVGVTILGAVLGRHHRRAAWLGAALFGAGYMALVFSRPAGQPPRAYLATDPVLRALRPRLSPAQRKIEAANARLLQTLEQPIPMRFSNETPLEDVLTYIKQATTTATHPGIPIYVDPIGLQEAERSLNSTVQIDLEGVPLRETLRLCLKQLGLVYEVKDGYVRITSEGEDPSAGLDDPFVVVAYCLVSLLAAGLGAMAAPIVAEAGRERPGRAAAEPSGPREVQAGRSAGVKSEAND